MQETSEDEEAKRKEAERKKKEKKGLSQAELDEIIDVELRETSTITLLYIPGTFVNQDTEEDAAQEIKNREYKDLR